MVGRAILVILIGASIAAGQAPALAQEQASRVAETLLPNVVRIRATRPSGTQHRGFGLVVAREGDRCVIATANHVVRDEGPDGRSREVTVAFYDTDGSATADLLPSHDPVLDVAVLSAACPATLAWNPAGMAPAESLQRDAPVVFIGRGAEMFIPAQAGAINGVAAQGTFTFEIRTAVIGTSGAPVISNDGIVGLVIRDETAGVVSAISIGLIRRLFEDWRRPWALGLFERPTADGFVAGTPTDEKLAVAVFGQYDATAKRAFWKPDESIEVMLQTTRAEPRSTRVESQILWKQTVQHGADEKLFVLWMTLDPEHSGCRPCVGVVGASVFVRERGGWRLRARNDRLAIGNAFSEPPDSRLERIGPDRHAIVMTGTWLAGDWESFLRNNGDGDVRIRSVVVFEQQNDSFTALFDIGQNESFESEPTVTFVPGSDRQYYDLHLETSEPWNRGVFKPRNSDEVVPLTIIYSICEGSYVGRAFVKGGISADSPYYACR